MSRHAQLRLAVWLVAIHLLVSLAHGLAHILLAIPASLGDDAFRVLIIGLAPVAALPLLRRSPTQAGGAGLLAASLAAAWLYGALNHFVFAGNDHVILPATTGAGWLFAITAILLFILEAGGALLGGILLRASLMRHDAIPARDRHTS